MTSQYNFFSQVNAIHGLWSQVDTLIFCWRLKRPTFLKEPWVKALSPSKEFSIRTDLRIELVRVDETFSAGGRGRRNLSRLLANHDAVSLKDLEKNDWTKETNSARFKDYFTT